MRKAVLPESLALVYAATAIVPKNFEQKHAARQNLC